MISNPAVSIEIRGFPNLPHDRGGFVWLKFSEEIKLMSPPCQVLSGKQCNPYYFSNKALAHPQNSSAAYNLRVAGRGARRLLISAKKP